MSITYNCLWTLVKLITGKQVICAGEVILFQFLKLFSKLSYHFCKLVLKYGSNNISILWLVSLFSYFLIDKFMNLHSTTRSETLINTHWIHFSYLTKSRSLFLLTMDKIQINILFHLIFQIARMIQWQWQCSKKLIPNPMPFSKNSLQWRGRWNVHDSYF